MKKIVTIFSALFALGMVACTPSQDKTIANLKTAIDGETAASAKYAAFSDQATKEGYPKIAALFQATSQAEAIHIKNHQAVLATLGVTDYVGAEPQFTVDSTARNLQTAIDGETYEFTTMYPDFIATAQQEKVNGALVSFNYAQDSEKGHAKLYAEALANMATAGVQASVYYVCPKCGNTYAGVAAESCELCQTPQADFLTFNAVIPIAEPIAAEDAAVQAN